MSFTWPCTFKQENGKTFIGISGYTFNLLFVEFPHKRQGTTVISAGAAATTVSKLIDIVTLRIQTSPLTTRDPKLNVGLTENLILSYIRDALKPFGGRLTKESQYGPVPISRFRRSTWPSVCR